MKTGPRQSDPSRIVLAVDVLHRSRGNVSSRPRRKGVNSDLAQWLACKNPTLEIDGHLVVGGCRFPTANRGRRCARPGPDHSTCVT